MGTCNICGKEMKRKGKTCSKCRTALYYEHAEVRFVMWNFIKHHGISLARNIYKAMIAEEGKDWTNNALGDKLVSKLHSDR